MPSLADLLRNDPWGAPPQTPLAKTVTDVGFDPSLGFAGAVDTYLARLKKMQGGLAQDMLDTAADPNAEGIQRAANLLGGLGLKIANVPMALMPSSQELRDRAYQAGASPEVQALGGALGDVVNIPDPATVGPALAALVKAGATAKGLAAAAPLGFKAMAVAPGKGRGLAELLADATPAEQAALKARLEAEAAQTGGQASSVSREQALNGLTGDNGIIAYHGSPHSFDKFDMSKIGTGEGAQAYGHGLYFAEKEDVARAYRDALSDAKVQSPDGSQVWSFPKTGGISLSINPNNEVDWAASSYLQNANGDVDKAISNIMKSRYADSPLEKKTIAKLNEWKSSGVKLSSDGSMYQVHLNVQPHELLDWDKPLSEQPKAVRDALHSQPEVQQRIADASKILGPKAADMKGESAYAALTGWRRGAQLSPPTEVSAAVSQRLKQAGVKGIKYKDAGSRDGVGGTNNYVIFDDNLITILKKYGIPMTAGAGGAMLVSGQHMPPDIAAQLQQQ